jgi:prepilin-type N-terminal cleavage/methylation domain-containing protein
VKPQTQGFTLIEVIVALVVLGAMTVALGQGTRFGLLAWNTAARMTNAGDSFDIVDRTLRTLIGQMDPGSQRAPPRFAAGSDTLSFVTKLPQSPEAPARRVEAVLAVDKSHRLVLRWLPYLAAERQLAPLINESELLPGVARMELFFWQPGGGWSEGWQAEGLPALVRIRLTLQEAGKRRWPDIVVAPELDRP